MNRVRFRVALALLSAMVVFAAVLGAQSTVDLADPFLGVDKGGNTVPGAAVPFGFVELSPDTTDRSTSGYSSEGLVLGFSHTHVSGTGGGSKYGNFRVTPVAGTISSANMASEKSEESATPGYYKVKLKQDQGAVLCELTASRLTGVERFTFHRLNEGGILLDITSHVLLEQKVTAAEASVLDDRHVAGSAELRGGWNPAPYKLYFYAEFSRPALRMGTFTANERGFRLGPGEKHVIGEQISNYRNRAGVFAVFETSSSPVVEVKVAVSFLSVEKAKLNLETEASGSFDQVREAARKKWIGALSKIQVTGGTEAQRKVFYSALYRVHYMPHDLTGENAWWQSTEPHYEDYYTLWDTFRALHPLLTLIQPERQRDMVRSLIDTYRHTGWLPDSRIAGANGLTQGGSNGDVLIADAMDKGLKGIDYETAYEALRKDAEVESDSPIAQGRQLEDYRKLGYMSLSYTRSASRTLEYAYNDYCISEVARALGHVDEAERYLKRSKNWKLLWDPAKKCIRPRYADGKWLEDFQCEHEYPDGTTEWWDAPFYEGSGFQYSTFVPHDVQGLIEQLGGNQKFLAWLDEFFDRKLYNPGNEPDLLAPYLYIFAGRPDRTADRVRSLLASEYHPGRDGLPGNDDAGTMTSWYVWSAIGIFPNAGQPYYFIGSPVFAHISIDLGGDKRFVVDAADTSDANRYVQSAELNHKPLDRAWLTNEEIAGGGRLVLRMGPQPSAWGTNTPPPNGIR